MVTSQQETLIRLWGTALRIAALFCFATLAFFGLRAPIETPGWVTETAAFGEYRVGAALRVDQIAGGEWACYTYTDVPNITAYEGSNYFSCRKQCFDCAHILTLSVFGRDDQIVQMTYTMQNTRLGDLALYHGAPDSITNSSRTGWAVWSGGRLRAMLADVGVDRYSRRVFVIRVG